MPEGKLKILGFELQPGDWSYVCLKDLDPVLRRRALRFCFPVPVLEWYWPNWQRLGFVAVLEPLIGLVCDMLKIEKAHVVLKGFRWDLYTDTLEIVLCHPTFKVKLEGCVTPIGELGILTPEVKRRWAWPGASALGEGYECVKPPDNTGPAVPPKQVPPDNTAAAGPAWAKMSLSHTGPALPQGWTPFSVHAGDAEAYTKGGVASACVCPITPFGIQHGPECPFNNKNKERT